MNASEATDANDVLRYLLDLRRHRHSAADGEAREAAARLAGHVNKTILVGITPVEVDVQWDAVGR
ncbi:hypothetical protein [Amycolatopsis sp. La24]|uniref:hypothetical protein n=1 Tax=Amycolatopsis sp. La24 TaxID=3028304 RepID=UPI0023B0E7BF|nr:hypothetical protein [Amycolatopsis sp. La24]